MSTRNKIQQNAVDAIQKRIKNKDLIIVKYDPNFYSLKNAINNVDISHKPVFLEKEIIENYPSYEEFRNTGYTTALARLAVDNDIIIVTKNKDYFMHLLFFIAASEAKPKTIIQQILLKLGL